MLILFIFRRVATLGFGNSFPVIFFNTKADSGPYILIIATPDKPGPDDKAKIVIQS